MHHDDPGIERRLLLAFGLAMLILAGWPSLARQMGWIPETQAPMQVVTQPYEKPQEITISGVDTPQIAIKELISRSESTTSSILGFAENSASIIQLNIQTPTYQIDPAELTLLTGHEGPGPGAVAWETRADGAVMAWDRWGAVAGPPGAPEVVYRGELAPGVTAELRYDLRARAQNAFAWTLSVANRAAVPYPVQPKALAGRSLHDPLEHGRYRLLRASVAGKIQTVTLKAGAVQRRFEGEVGWVTAQTKYYTTIVQPQTPAAALVVTRDAAGQAQGWVEWPAAMVPPGETRTWTFRGYAGPLDYRFLDALQLDHAASLGAFTTITRLLQTALNWLTGLFHSYGTAIVVLTLLLGLLFYPLTWTSLKTMKKMELLQPELKQLQERHKSDPKRINEEAMKLYKQHRVNPLGGCLPLLLQMPLFIALYQVLGRSPELRGAHFLLIKDLAAPDALLPLPAVLPLVGSALNVLPLAMAGMMFLQQKMSSKGKVLTDEQRVQQQVFKFMPLLFGAMFYALPSGLVLYWLLNTTFTVVQQQLVIRKLT